MTRALRSRFAAMGLIVGGIAFGYLAACSHSKPEQTAGAALAPQTKDDAPTSEADAGVGEALAAYVKAFNDHDSAALGQIWTEDAVYVDDATGERREGREALQSDFQALFDQSPELRLNGQIESIDLITPGVAQVEGLATVVRGDGSQSVAHFSALFVSVDDTWRLRSVHESSVPQPASAGDALADLEWMIGHWTDDSHASIKVDTVVRWAPGGSFLVRAFTISNEEGVQREGTQIIGWDPRAQEIRSWSFNSDGSFGDGVWSHVDGSWYVKSSQTLADGAAASGTFVMTPQGDDSLTLQLIGHEIEGEAKPASEVVTMTRISASSDTAAAAGTEVQP